MLFIYMNMERRMSDSRETTHKYGYAVLAGGAGKRMGGANKAVLEYNGGTFLNHICSEMEKTHSICYLSAANHEQTTPCGWIEVNDIVTDAEGKYIAPMVINTETGNVDYVWNARELYRVFLRTGGAPHRKGATAFDSLGAETAMPYPELLGDKEWNLTPDYEETAILVDGKPYKCAVAHNLGQVRKLLEGDYRNYAVIRLMA